MSDNNILKIIIEALINKQKLLEYNNIQEFSYETFADKILAE